MVESDLKGPKLGKMTTPTTRTPPEYGNQRKNEPRGLFKFFGDSQSFTGQKSRWEGSKRLGHSFLDGESTRRCWMWPDFLQEAWVARVQYGVQIDRERKEKEIEKWYYFQ